MNRKKKKKKNMPRTAKINDYYRQRPSKGWLGGRWLGETPRKPSTTRASTVVLHPRPESLLLPPPPPHDSTGESVAETRKEALNSLIPCSEPAKQDDSTTTSFRFPSKKGANPEKLAQESREPNPVPVVMDAPPQNTGGNHLSIGANQILSGCLTCVSRNVPSPNKQVKGGAGVGFQSPPNLHDRTWPSPTRSPRPTHFPHPFPERAPLMPPTLRGRGVGGSTTPFLHKRDNGSPEMEISRGHPPVPWTPRVFFADSTLKNQYPKRRRLQNRP